MTLAILLIVSGALIAYWGKQSLVPALAGIASVLVGTALLIDHLVGG